jgi:hypothetical protein
MDRTDVSVDGAFFQQQQAGMNDSAADDEDDEEDDGDAEMAPAALVMRADTAATRRWVQQVVQDDRGARLSLRTLLMVLTTDDGTPTTESRQCIGVIRGTSLLDDTEITLDIVDAFAFTEEELNRAPRAAMANLDVSAVEARGRRELGDATFGPWRRALLLDLLHRMGETKTCLRYIVALVDAGRSDLLKKYVRKIQHLL